MVALCSSASLSTDVISRPADLAALAPEWEALLNRADLDTPAVSPLWFDAWWRVFGANRQLRAVAVRRGKRLVGLAPLGLRVRWLAPGLPIRRLELLPSGEPIADEIASDEIGVLAERGAEQDVAHFTAERIASGSLGGWDELVMPALSMNSLLVPLLTSSLEQTGLLSRLDVVSGSPYIPLASSWDGYLTQLRSGPRRRLLRALDRFGRWAGSSSTLHTAETQSELDEGAAILRQLHQARWRAVGRPGAFASPRFSAFHQEVMPRLLERGALELSWLVARGRPVAALYNIHWNGKVHFYQSGRLPDLPAEVQPGLVIHALAIQRAISLGRREYDFLAGGARYKLELALATRPIGRIRVMRARWLERARWLGRRCAAFVPGRASRRRPVRTGQ